MPDKTYDNGRQDAELKALRDGQQDLRKGQERIEDKLDQFVTEPRCRQKHNRLWAALGVLAAGVGGLAIWIYDILARMAGGHT